MAKLSIFLCFVPDTRTAASLWQQWLGKQATELYYTYVHYLRCFYYFLYNNFCILLPSGAQIPGLSFLRWRLVFEDSQYGTCFMSPFWRLEFGGGSKISEKCVHPSFSLH
jgi:hypothetical protein